MCYLAAIAILWLVSSILSAALILGYLDCKWLVYRNSLRTPKAKNRIFAYAFGLIGGPIALIVDFFATSFGRCGLRFK